MGKQEIYADFSLLPQEILLLIFKQLKLEDLYNVRLVNSTFCSVSSDDEIWQQLFLKRYKEIKSNEPLWKQLFHFATKLENEYFIIEQQFAENQMVQDRFSRVQSQLERELHDCKLVQAEMECQIREQQQMLEIQKMDFIDLETTFRKQQERFKMQESRYFESNREIEDLQTQLKTFKEQNRELKKELNEVRGILYTEQFQINKLQRDNERKERLLQKVVQSNKDKTVEIQVLKETLERSVKDERSKRTSLERRVEALKEQFAEGSEINHKHSSVLTQKQQALQKLLDQEQAINTDLRKENIRLERDMKRMKEKHDAEILKMKELMSRVNQVKALSFAIKAKA